MYPAESGGPSNGRQSSNNRAALIVDNNTGRHLQLRAALRQTGLFSVTHSVESVEMARDVVEADDISSIAIALVAIELSDDALPFFSPELLKKTVLTHEPEISPESTFLALPRPVSASVLEDVFSQLA